MKSLLVAIMFIVVCSAYSHQNKDNPHHNLGQAGHHHHDWTNDGYVSTVDLPDGRHNHLKEVVADGINIGDDTTPGVHITPSVHASHGEVDEIGEPEPEPEPKPPEVIVEPPINKPPEVIPSPVVVTPPVAPVVDDSQKVIQTGFTAPKRETTSVPFVVTPQPVPQTTFAPPLVVIAEVAEPVEPEPKKKRSLMLPPPKRNPYTCHLPRPNRRVEILKMSYDEEYAAMLITFRNWDIKPVILNYYTVALFNKEGEEVHKTSIGKSRYRYRGRLYIEKRARKQEYKDSTFAVIQRKHLKDVYPKLKEKHRLASAFVMFHRHLFDKSWMDKEWTVKISCGEEVVFQYPVEVETEAPAAPSLIRKGMLSTTWGHLKMDNL